MSADLLEELSRRNVDGETVQMRDSIVQPHMASFADPMSQLLYSGRDTSRSLQSTGRNRSIPPRGAGMSVSLVATQHGKSLGNTAAKQRKQSTHLFNKYKASLDLTMDSLAHSTRVIPIGDINLATDTSQEVLIRDF